MKYSIISFVVFLLSVDSTFSLQCYTCNNTVETDQFQICDNPKPTICGPDADTCVKLTAARQMESIYGCAGDLIIQQVVDCKDYPDNCTLCHEDLCNEPDKKTTQNSNSLKCYECFEDDSRYSDNKPAPESNKNNFTLLNKCFSDKVLALKIRCYPNEQCVDARSNLDLRRYHGCVKDTKNFCEQYDFENCTFCDKNLCNEVKRVNSTNCLECYSGTHSLTVGEMFKNYKSCSKPKFIKCGRSEQCVAAFDKLGKLRYHDCVPISNKPGEFCEKYGFYDCELCDLGWCLIPKKTRSCYECQFKDPSLKISDAPSPNSLVVPNCSQPLIRNCSLLARCLTLTGKENGKLVGVIHTCTEPSTFEEDCTTEGVDCQYCDEDLCNKVGNYTTITPHRKTSSAEILKNNNVSLFNVLFIFIIIHAAL